MKSCDVDKITLNELYDAITHKDGAKHSIIVPIFQRGKSWDDDQEREFVDSVRMGLPFGSMLVYRRIVSENNETIFVETLIDGLQRSNAIKKYIEHPLRFTKIDNIADSIVSDILVATEKEDNKDNSKLIKASIKSLFEEMDQKRTLLSEIDPSDVAEYVLDNLLQTNEYSAKLLREVKDYIKPYINELQQEYKEITSVVVPLVVYDGDEKYLPIIFKKINSSGVELSPLEIYSATWPNTKRVINNELIVNAILNKYDQLVDTGFTLEGYDPNTLRRTKELTAFEYVFGLSKYINSTFDFLSYFESKEQPDTINSLAFELVNVCLNQNKDGKDKLYENILAFPDVNLFEKCLMEAIKFVQDRISLVTAFKGNSRTDKSVKFHGKFQIMSLVANTFREMYDPADLSKHRDTWEENKKVLERNIVLYYVYDVLNDNTWNNGGTTKIYTFTTPNRYMQPITYAQWSNCLDTFFEETNMNIEKINPDKKDKLFLNCIYLDIFSYKDHADSEIKFDIEHLATKELMKKIKSNTKCSALVVGNIGNLCYLKEGTNREKHEKTIYQYEPIREQIPEIEEKYSFTKKADLDWVEKEYEEKDAEEIRKIYYKYLKDRFEIQKKKFFASLGIQAEADNTENDSQSGNRIVPPLPEGIEKVGQFIRAAMKNLSDVGFVFTDEEIANLCNVTWCQKNLGTGKKYAFAKLHVEGAVNEHKVGKDNIFIKSLFTYGKNSILIKSDLFDYNREPFITWYESLSEE